MLGEGKGNVLVEGKPLNSSKAALYWQWEITLTNPLPLTSGFWDLWAHVYFGYAEWYYQADRNSLLDYEWMQIINLVTAWCLCYPLQKRPYSAFFPKYRLSTFLISFTCCLLPVDGEVPHAFGKSTSGCLG